MLLVSLSSLQIVCSQPVIFPIAVFFFKFMLCVCFTFVWILWGVAFVLVVWILWVAATASVKSTVVYYFGGDGVWISWAVLLLCWCILLLCCWYLNSVGYIAFVLVYIAWILWVMVTINVKLVCIVRTPSAVLRMKIQKMYEANWTIFRFGSVRFWNQFLFGLNS